MDLFHPIGLQKPTPTAPLAQLYWYQLRRRYYRERAAMLASMGLMPLTFVAFVQYCW